MADVSAFAKCKEWLKLIMAISIIAYIFTITILLFTHGMPADEGTKDILIALAGGALTMWKEVSSFVFGSSQGSQDKDATIAAMTPPVKP